MTSSKDDPNDMVKGHIYVLDNAWLHTKTNPKHSLAVSSYSFLNGPMVNVFASCFVSRGAMRTQVGSNVTNNQSFW